MWINGKNTQTAVIMNPSPDNQLNINRTIVSVRVSKQNTTKCHPLDQLWYVSLTDVERLANDHHKYLLLLQKTFEAIDISNNLCEKCLAVEVVKHWLNSDEVKQHGTYRQLQTHAGAD